MQKPRRSYPSSVLRSQRRKLARTRFEEDRRDFPVEMTYWAVDASLKEGRASLAAVPCTQTGEVDGPVVTLRPVSTALNTAHVELLACLVAHTRARADGEVSPLIYTDSFSALPLLEGLQDRLQQADPGLLPELAALACALGPELHAVRLYALPRRTNAAMRRADNAARHVNAAPNLFGPAYAPDQEWAHVGLDQVISAARALR